MPAPDGQYEKEQHKQIQQSLNGTGQNQITYKIINIKKIRNV